MKRWKRRATTAPLLRNCWASPFGRCVTAWKWWPTLIVLGSVILFGIIVNSVGLVFSTIILIVLSSAASHEFRYKEALISGVLLAALAVAVFVIGLKLQLPIWPGSS